MDHSHHKHEHKENEGLPIKLIDKREVAEGTMSFTFERPLGFNFNAGQHIEITLIDPLETDAEGNTRTFSIVNAPHEPNLVVATRMRDTAFKRVLKDLPTGSSMLMKGPFGNFLLHNNTEKPAVFLIGGIGITPVCSMISDATERKFPHKLMLLYSNRRPEDTAFLDDLLNLAKKNQNFTFIPTMSEMERSSRSWDGEKGYISKDMLTKYVPDVQTPVYYLSGPANMVAAMRTLLNEIGVDPDNIRTEEFSGY